MNFKKAVKNWYKNFGVPRLKDRGISEAEFLIIFLKLSEGEEAKKTDDLKAIEHAKNLFLGKTEPDNNEAKIIFAISRYLEPEITPLNTGVEGDESYVEKIMAGFAKMIAEKDKVIGREIRNLASQNAALIKKQIEVLLSLLEARPELTAILGLERLLSFLEEQESLIQLKPKNLDLVIRLAEILRNLISNPDLPEKELSKAEVKIKLNFYLREIRKFMRRHL